VRCCCGIEGVVDEVGLGILWLVFGDRSAEGAMLDERGEDGRYICVWDVLSNMCAV